jgi:hypothetical protein
MKIKIPYHSFVDLITNSSSEVFVEAHEGTIDAFKAAINHVLKSQGVEKSADDLFTFELGELYENEIGNDRSLIITSKLDDEETKKAATALSSIVGSFVVTGGYNG